MKNRSSVTRRRSDLSRHARAGCRAGQRAAIHTKQGIIPTTIFATAAVAGFVVTVVEEIAKAAIDAFGEPAVPTPIPRPQSVAGRFWAAGAKR